MPETLDVLVVVDVQNCFMYNLHPDKNNAGDFLHLDGEDVAKQMAKEIANMTTISDLVVFTRDFHPINHISFAGDEGRELKTPQTWPRHCRNRNRVCNHTDKEINLEDLKLTESMPQSQTKYEDLLLDRKVPKPPIEGNPPVKVDPTNPKTFDVVGPIFNKDIFSPLGINQTDIINSTDISYFFYDTPIGAIVYDLNKNAKEGINKIGLESTAIENEIQIIVPNNDTGKLNTNEVELYADKYITLKKGERCNQESYSAFNYHIDYNIDKPAEPVRKTDFNSIKEENSTGLWEFIIKQYNNRKKDQKGLDRIRITVCGLVTQVCVMHTVIQGRMLWDNIYAKKFGSNAPNVEFILSLKGTGFTSAFSPKKPNSEIVIKGKESPDFLALNKYITENIPEELADKPDTSPIFKYLLKDGQTTIDFTLPTPENTTPPPDTSSTATTPTQGGKRRKTYKGNHKRTCKCKICGGGKRKTRKHQVRKSRKNASRK
jgi:nicotinamidase-related amidase